MHEFPPETPPQPASDATTPDVLPEVAMIPPSSVFPEPPMHLPAAREAPAWGMVEIGLFVVFAAVSVLFCGSLTMIWAMHSSAFKGQTVDALAQNPMLLVPPQIAAYLLILWCIWWLVRQKTEQRFSDAVKWNWPKSPARYAATGVVLAVVIQIASNFLPIPKSLPIEQYFRQTSSAYLIAAFGILAAPVVEELIFRGFLFPVFARRAGTLPAIVLTALLFAAIHQSQLAHAWAPLLMLFVVGLVLTSIRALRQSVAATFIVHLFYNTTLFALLWIATDHFRHLERAGQ